MVGVHPVYRSPTMRVHCHERAFVFQVIFLFWMRGVSSFNEIDISGATEIKNTKYAIKGIPVFFFSCTKCAASTQNGVFRSTNFTLFFFFASLCIDIPIPSVLSFKELP